MKIVVTGSLGHIGRHLAPALIKQGHEVTVISSKADKSKDIEAIGATAAIGDIEDVAFLTRTFTGADAVYTMLPPPQHMADPTMDVMEHTSRQANCYATAIRQSGVKRVVQLSSIGAHTNVGNGLLRFHYNVESILNALPQDVAITFMRPTAFYYNLLAFIPTIKAMGFIASNYGGNDIVPWVAPADIATAIAEEITAPPTGRKVRYVTSEEISCNHIAHTLGTAIGKPELEWKVIPDAQMEAGMISAGLPAGLVKGLVDMNAAMHRGDLFEDYNKNKPALSKTKLSSYAPEFAAIYNSK